MSEKSLSDKRALLAKLLQRQAYDCPLSHGQQALWSIYQSAPDSSAYNMAWSVKLTGDLNSGVLQEALELLVKRHSALRTSMELVDGEPVQTVQPAGTYSYGEHAMLGCSEEELNNAITAAYEKPFDLTLGPVLRVDVFQSAEQERVLLLSLQHVFGDASSMTILGTELLTIYEAKLNGEDEALPALPSSYADFVRFEADALSDASGEELTQFWQEKLGVEETPILKLPTDYARPPVMTYNGSSHVFLLSEELTGRFNDFTKEKAATPFTVLLTAFQILLYRYSGNKDIWLGTPASNPRRKPQFANLVGYLANTVVLPTTIADPAKSTFLELLSENKQNLFEVIEHSAYPFLQLVKDFQTTRDPSYSPLFQATLDYQTDVLPETVGGLSVEPFDFAQMEGQFELRFGFTEEDPLRCRIYYNTDLFSAETIERMSEHFQVLLGAIIDGADRSIATLPMMSESESNQIQSWGDSAMERVAGLENSALADLLGDQTNVDGSKVYIMDENHQVTSIGVPGQVCIAGLNASGEIDVELFGNMQSVVQTGHMAKWLPNGDIASVVDEVAESADAPKRENRYVYPRDELEFQVVQVWEELFDMSPISVLDDFFKIGGDSLLGIRLIFSIQKTFGVSLQLQELFENRTPEKLTMLVREDYVAPEWSPLVCLQPEGDKSPFFIIHASGGTAFDFIEIAKGMGTERPFYALQPSGIELGQEFHPTIEDMAADYVVSIRSVQEKGPYLLAGWSFGASVAFEMIRILEKEGEEISLLLMIDAPAPTANVCKEDDFEFLMDRIPHFYGADLGDMDLDKSTEEKVAYLLDEVKLTGLFTPDIDPDYAQHWLRMYKHHNQMVGVYEPNGTINTKVIFLKPSEKIPFDEQMGNPSVAWRSFTEDEYLIFDGPGNHFSMVSPLNTEPLVELIQNCLADHLDD